jgi:hypothetical protein
MPPRSSVPLRARGYLCEMAALTMAALTMAALTMAALTVSAPTTVALALRVPRAAALA